MVKPKQKFFRAGGPVGEPLTNRRTVLAQGIAARLRAVETQAVLVGAMVVNRIVGARLSVPPGSRTVVVPSPHDVMKAQGYHVVHQCLVRLEHDTDDNLYRF